jgi:predicted Zn finger-like uncharacterized protein
MDVRCDKCQARYRIDDARIGPQGLAMRCGKCGNTFRATREPAPPAAVTPVKPAMSAGATVMFAAPAASARPAGPPQKAAPAKAGVGPAGSAMASLGDEGAGRTIMFNASPALRVQTPGRTPAGTVKPLSKPTDAGGATLVFGASPAAAPQIPAAKIKPGAAATIVFGKAPPPPARAPATEVPTPPPPTTPPRTLAATTAPAIESSSANEPGAAGRAGQIDEGDQAAMSDGAEAAEPPEATGAESSEQPSVRQGPPRALVIGVAGALASVLLLAGVVIAVKKLGHRTPPQAAVEALADARAAAEKDTLASLAEAEALANAALGAAPRANFPQAHAQLAEVEIAWADALDDQAWYWGERANRALMQGDDKTKAEAEAKAAALQDAAKARLKTAFEAAAAGNKMDPKSPEVALALADYYRAARSRLNLNRELKRATLLKGDAARIAFVQGAELLAQDEGAPRAVEKLKAALAGSPQSARIRFRIAMALFAMHDEAAARKELLETLRLSPQHERARLAMELLAPSSAPAPARQGEGATR